MRTTFGTFNIATSGLFASQRALDITSNNISNANTEGYSRQKVLQRASLPIGGDPRGLVGTGVETYDIVQIRSQYMDNKYWGQVKEYSEWKTKSEGMEEIEAIFNEPSDTGIRKVMDDLFASMEELVKKPGDSTNRVNLIEKGVILASTINKFGNEVISSIRETNFAIKSKVEEINALAKQIASLNEQIFNLELDGHKANGLRDQRATTVDKLSKIVNISVSEVDGEDNIKYFNVRLGGITLVNHYNRNELTVDDQPNPGVSEYGAGKIAVVKWAGVDGKPLDEAKIEGGELRGLLDLRDGDGMNHTYRGLPYYLNELNRFARDFAREFNIQHRAGFGLNGSNQTNFFEEPAGNWKNINCTNLKVNSMLQSDPSLVATAGGANTGESDNENIKKLAAFRNKKDVFLDVLDQTGTKKIDGTADDFLKSVLSVLSVDSNQAKRLMTNTEAIVDQTQNRRMSESGVSMDEEMGDMVKFQQAYNASAKMITTLDRIMDTMINRMGMVGR